MKHAPIDYSLYLVTDRGLARGRAMLDIVRAAVQGGVTCVQLREKTCATREFIEEALAVKEFLRSRGVPLIINDRVDVALAVGADGVHLGQKDMPLAAARAIVTDTMLIGISAESLADAVAAQQGGADYLGVSPIFATPTKTDAAAPLGLAGLANHPPGGTHPARRHRRPQPTERRRRGPVRGGRGRGGVGHRGRGRPGAGGPGTRAGHPVSEAHMGLRDIGEFGFIKRIRRGCLTRPEAVIRGIGDDAAAFRTDGRLVSLITTDLLVERVHFLREAISGRDLGYKSLAVNLSDIAAMGGTAREAFVSIAIPEELRARLSRGHLRGHEGGWRPSSRSTSWAATRPAPWRTWSSMSPCTGWSPKARS